MQMAGSIKIIVLIISRVCDIFFNINRRTLVANAPRRGQNIRALFEARVVYATRTLSGGLQIALFLLGVRTWNIMISLIEKEL